VGEPRVLILDEPFTALDDASKSDAMKLTKQVIKDFKIPTLLVSHDLREINEFTTQVYKLSGGVVHKTI
jgi:ABC-type sulfate/molybdate transport systems ATPase subunit